MIGQHFRIGCWMIGAMLALFPLSSHAGRITSLGDFESGLDGWTFSGGAPGSSLTAVSSFQDPRSPSIFLPKSGSRFALGKSTKVPASYDLRLHTSPVIEKRFKVRAGDVISGWVFFILQRVPLSRSEVIVSVVEITPNAKNSIAVINANNSEGRGYSYPKDAKVGPWQHFTHIVQIDGEVIINARMRKNFLAEGDGLVGFDGFQIETSDSDPPVVTAPTAVTITMNSTEDGLLPSDSRLAAFLNGATAVDDRDGSLPAEAINLPLIFVSRQTKVIFQAVDKSGNIGLATAIIIIEVTDSLPIVTAPPELTIILDIGKTELNASEDRIAAFLNNASAQDIEDGSIPAKVVNQPPSFPLGTTEVRFEAVDKFGNIGFAVSKIVILKANIPPSAIDDIANGLAGQNISIQITSNDNDEDGDQLSVALGQPPEHGTFTLNQNGGIDYTAQIDFVGSDSYTYTISDGHGGTASATVTITVKSPFGPVVTAPPELIIEVDAGVDQVAASDKRIAEFLSRATALDEIDGDVSAVAVDVPRTFQLGETTVRFQAVDLDGNIGFAYSKVTVKSIPGICKSAPDLVDFEPDSADTHVGPFYSVRPIPSEAIFSKQDAQTLHPDLVAFRIVDGIRQGYKFLPAENTWIVDYDLVDHTPADPELLGKTYYGFAPEETYSVYESVVGGIVSLRYMGYDCFALNRGPWGGSYFTPFDYEYAGGGSVFDRRDLAKNWQRISFKMNWGLTRDAADSGESYWLIKKHWGSDKFRQLVFAAHVDVAIFSDEDLAKRIMSIGHNLGYPCPNSIYEPGDERIESLYQPGEIFGAVFDEENVRLETGTGKKPFESPFLFFGRRCRSVIRVFLGVGGRIGGRIHSAEQFGGFDSHASSLEINQLGKAIVNKVLENLERITAGFELRNSQNLVELSEAFEALPFPVDSYDRDKNIYVYTLPEKNPVKPIPKAVSGKPSPGVSPPADPQPLPEKPRTPTDIMSAIEKNFHKLSHEEQEELINKLKHLPLDEREQLSPLFRDLLKKGK